MATARITRWKLQLREQAAQIFAEAPVTLPTAPVVEPLDVGFCLQAHVDALRVAPAPHIFNSDQGSQFTSQAYEQALLTAGCRISRDDRGRATDNAFIERLLRTIKWEHIYLNPAVDGHHLHQQLTAYFAYYNHRRPHQNLDGQTPAHVYRASPTWVLLNK